MEQSYLKEKIYYDPDTGDITRIMASGENSYYLAGTIQTTRAGKKYRIIQINYKLYLAHRLAWLYMYGGFPRDQIDHIDGDGLNNKIKNLREATNLENARNQRLPSHNTSGVCGVSWQKSRNKWISSITAKGKRITLGRFKNKDDAIKIRKKAEIKYGYHLNHGTVRPL